MIHPKVNSTDNLLPSWRQNEPASVDVAVIGAGFCGMLATIHLLRSQPRLRISIFEQLPIAVQERLESHQLPYLPVASAAFSACDEQHLLNVVAGNMGAFPEAPADFYTWLQEKFPGQFAPTDFVPRTLYGDYVSQLFATEVLEKKCEVSFIEQQVVTISKCHTTSGDDTGSDNALSLTDSSGVTTRAGYVLLCVGLPQGIPPWNTRLDDVPAERLLANPWSPRALSTLPTKANVVVFGSGLTALDIVGSLTRQNHQGRITLLSRNARLPLPHVVFDPSRPQEKVIIEAASLVGLSPHALVKVLRSTAQKVQERKGDWQQVLDAIRPHTSQIWSAWNETQQRLFIRKIRPLWEIHRHRAPHTLLNKIAELQEAGQLELTKGRLVEVQGVQKSKLLVKITHAGTLQEIEADFLINCTGPVSSLHLSTDPLLTQLLESGVATTDGLGLGLQTNLQGRLINKELEAEERELVAGSLRRGTLWESTAVPDLRVQAAEIARVVAERFGNS